MTCQLLGQLHKAHSRSNGIIRKMPAIDGMVTLWFHHNGKSTLSVLFTRTYFKQCIYKFHNNLILNYNFTFTFSKRMLVLSPEPSFNTMLSATRLFLSKQITIS